MHLVLLATFALMPEGEPGGDLLVSALAERGIDARWVRWDDPGVDWAAADLVAVRATWDYHRRYPEFVAWLRAVAPAARILNGADVLLWNADKAYLTLLAGLVPVVPTALVDDAGLVAGLGAGLAQHGAIVVKPRVGAGGGGVVVVESLEDERLAGLTPGPWVVQPLVESVRTRGETSVFVMDGRAVAQVDKAPAPGEIRVHGFHGGTCAVVDLGADTAAAAEAAMAAAADLLGAPLDYGRVDLMEYGGCLVVSEVELIEPGLYLDVHPGNAQPFADLVAARVREASAGTAGFPG